MYSQYHTQASIAGLLYSKNLNQHYNYDTLERVPGEIHRMAILSSQVNLIFFLQNQYIVYGWMVNHIMFSIQENWPFLPLLAGCPTHCIIVNGEYIPVMFLCILEVKP